MLVGQAKKDFEKWYFNRSKYKKNYRDYFIW